MSLLLLLLSTRCRSAAAACADVLPTVFAALPAGAGGSCSIRRKRQVASVAKNTVDITGSVLRKQRRQLSHAKTGGWQMR
jgi:hypothetical protein